MPRYALPGPSLLIASRLLHANGPRFGSAKRAHVHWPLRIDGHAYAIKRHRHFIIRARLQVPYSVWQDVPDGLPPA